MSQKGNSNKLLSVADLKCAILDIERDLSNCDKSLLSKLIKGFGRLTELLYQKESVDVFPIVVTWFRLYLKMQNSIDPNNNKLLQQYEKTVPTAISYIIGCLQYNVKDASNFHYNLLEIIDALLHNSHPNVVKQCANFSNGTIGCIWKPITFAGDFNTQTLALKVLAKLLKSLDTDKQEGELKTIKWSNLNLFKDKLNKVIEGTSQKYIYETACRELLNNFNMELTRNMLIYSLHCKSLVIGENFKFFKTLIIDKFWIDINFLPKTISFRGRHKIKMNLNFEDFDVNLKWTNIQIDNGCLLITIEKTIESKLPDNILSKLKKSDNIKIYLEAKEEERLKNNKHMMKYINLMETTRNNVQHYNKEKSPEANTFNNNHEAVTNFPETPITTRSNSTKNVKPYFLRQSTPKRKFFSYINEKDTMFQTKQTKKKTSNKKSRILKPRSQRKSVCKVVPVVVDLTRTPEFRRSPNIQSQQVGTITNIEQNIIAGNECRISDNQCLTILKKITGSTTDKPKTYNYHYESDAEPCQSYCGFKTRSGSSCSDNSNVGVCKTERTKNNNHTKKPNEERQLEKTEKPSAVCPRNTQFERFRGVNKNGKENASMQQLKLQTNNKRKLLSQNIFDQIKDDGSTPPRPSKISKKTSTAHLDHNTINENEEYDSEYDVLRFSDQVVMCSTPGHSPQSYPRTPTPTSAMNISDITKTPTHTSNASDHFLLKEPRTEIEITDHCWFGADKQVGNEILNDCQNHQRDTSSGIFKKEIQMAEELNDLPEYICEKNNHSSNLTDCVIYRKRLDSDDGSDSDGGDFNLDANDLRSHICSITISKKPEFPEALKPVLNRISPNKKMLFKELMNNDILSKTKFQVRTVERVEQRDQINAEETVIFNTHVKSTIINNGNDTQKHFTLYKQTLLENSRNSLPSNCDLNNMGNRCKSIAHSTLSTLDNNMVVQCPQKFKLKLNTEEELMKQSAETQNVNSVKATIPHSINSLGNNHNDRSLYNKANSRQSPLKESENKETCTNANVQPDPQWLSGEIEYSQDTDNSEDSISNAAYWQMSQNEERFKKEISQLKEQYYIKLRNTLNNIRPQCLANTFDETKNILCEVTENILRQSKEHRKELSLLQMTMTRLMREMKQHYEIYANRNKQFQCFQENAERVLDAFGCLNLQSGLSNGYQDVIDQLNVSEINICQNIWQTFFEAHKQNLLEKINSLSEI